jgi:hypothetical protein
MMRGNGWGREGNRNEFFFYKRGDRFLSRVEPRWLAWRGVCGVGLRGAGRGGEMVNIKVASRLASVKYTIPCMFLPK